MHGIPSHLETLFDMHHDGVQERFHITSDSGGCVTNGHEG